MANKKKNSLLDKAIIGTAKLLPGPLRPTIPAPQAPPVQQDPTNTQNNNKVSTEKLPSSTDTQSKTFQNEKGVTSGIQTPSGNGKYQVPTGKTLPDGSKELRPASLEEYNNYKASQGFSPSGPGSTFFGLGPKDVAKIQEAQNAKTAVPQGAITQEQANQIRAQEEQAAINASLASEVGTLDPNIVQQGGQASPIDIGQLVGAGIAAAAPGAIGGAVVGGIAGGGVGAIPGAVLGSVGGFLTGVRSNLKAQRAGSITAGSEGLKDGEKNLRAFITAANKDPQNTAEYWSQFNEQLSYIERDFGRLRLDTSGYIKDLSGADGTPQLEDYQRFYDVTRPYLIREMQTALLNPNPTKDLLPTDVGGQEQS